MSFISTQIHNNIAYLVTNNSIALQKILTPYTLAGFELAIFSYIFGDTDHYTTPPGNHRKLFGFIFILKFRTTFRHKTTFINLSQYCEH
jgi:hypothetical protein